MMQDLLAEALEQAELAPVDVRAAALLHAARVQGGDLGHQTFARGMEAASALPPRDREFLMEHARMLAAAVDPTLLPDVPQTGRMRHSGSAERIAQIMLEHGHRDAAVSFVMEYSDPATFPFGIVAPLIGQTGTAELLRKAIDAWTNAPDDRFTGDRFLWLFGAHWKMLSAEEARKTLREIVRRELEREDTPINARYDGSIEFASGRQNNLFQVWHVLRDLDPALAETLSAGNEQLAAAVIRYPKGMDSFREEAEERRKKAPPAAGRGYVMGGAARDFPFMRALLDAEASGDFAAPFAHALERYIEDIDPENRNQVSCEFWSSTCEFRSIVYRAAQRFGRDAAVECLAKIPDAGVKLLAQIEAAAALADLPELQGIRREFRPPIRAARVAEPEVAPGIGGTTGDDSGIRCPKCKYRPRAEDRWSCKCGHSWNTFDTGGVCPSCLYQWKITACPRCGQWSPHSDWYGKS